MPYAFLEKTKNSTPNNEHITTRNGGSFHLKDASHEIPLKTHTSWHYLRIFQNSIRLKNCRT